MSASTIAEDVIKSAASVARDVAEGRMQPGELAQAVVSECRGLFGVVVGEDDPLFGLQCEIARGVLAVGGLPASEVAEWAAVARRRERPNEAVRAVEPPDPSIHTSDEDSSFSSPHSPDSGDPEPEPEAGMDP